MASIAFTVTMADGSSFSKTATVSDAEVGRLVAWGTETFSPEMDADGKPLEKTPPWVVGRWISGPVAETFAKVQQHEQSKAAAVASAAVKPIPVAIT